MLLTGDFNAEAGNSIPYDTLTGPYVDTWQTTQRRATPAYGTFPGYDSAKVGEKRIDWVLATPEVRVHAAVINVRQSGGVWPSDHAPAQALLQI